MSQDDVALVMYPSTLMRADFYQERYEGACRALRALRYRLRELDPSLPIEYDGTSWMQLEAEWLSKADTSGLR
jgi:hypothetical protein